MANRWHWVLALSLGLSIVACGDKKKKDDTEDSDDEDDDKKKKKKKKKDDDEDEDDDKKAKDGVELKLDKDAYQAGDKIVVSFGAALPKENDQHWLTLVKDGSPDTEWGNWHIVKSGADKDELETKEGGAFEVRLHSNYPKKSSNVVARKKVTVAGEASLVSLEKTTFKKGETINVTYTKDLPSADGRYWLTIVTADSPPSAWGTWHYVAAGAKTDKLPTPTAGRMEVRLHSLYPRKQHNMIASKVVTVE